MNDSRRKTLTECIAQIEAAKDRIQEVLDEEQESFDNMPENFQSGDKGEAAQVVIGSLEDAISDIEATIEDIGSALNP